MSDPEPSPSTSPGHTVLERDPRCSAVLGGVAGFVDAAGFLVIMGLFTAHMSGNSTGLAVALATGDWAEAARRGFVIPLFILATMAGVAWIESQSDPTLHGDARGRAVAGVLAAEVVLLMTFVMIGAAAGGAVSFAAHPAAFLGAASAAALAMGLQNAALLRVQSVPVHTTFITGTLTTLAVALVQWRRSAREIQKNPAARRARDSAGFTARLTFCIWLSYLAGAFAGAWLVSRYGVMFVLLPVVTLAGLIIVLRRPSAPLS